MKRTKTWWDHLTPSEKTELVMIERSGTHGQPCSERRRELVAKADRAEAAQQALDDRSWELGLEYEEWSR